MTIGKKLHMIHGQCQKKTCRLKGFVAQTFNSVINPLSSISIADVIACAISLTVNLLLTSSLSILSLFAKAVGTSLGFT